MEGRCLESRINQLLCEGDAIGNPFSDPPVSINISRAPRSMHRVHPEAYEPQLVSIGPLHLWDEAVQPMLKHKLRFYLRLSDRLYGVRNINNDLRGILGDELVDQAIQCYPESETLALEKQDFSLMLALDGCFILELFRYDLRNKEGIVVDEPIFETRWMLPALRLDLIKLGNQLPFFILERLYDLTTSRDEPSLKLLALNFISPLIFPGQVNINRNLQDGGHAHLLALFHSIFAPTCLHTSLPISDPNSQSQVHERGSNSIDTVTELGYYGITLRTGEGGDLLDIKFDKGVLKIPSLQIDHNTASLFRNLVAYEQCNTRVPSYFTSYIHFIDGLVNSSNDVMVLRKRGIINHTLGSDEEVAAQINSLLKEVASDGRHNYLSTPIQGIGIHKKKPFNLWMASLSRAYFSEPDKTLTILLGLYALYFTVIQTVFAILSYLRPNS